MSANTPYCSYWVYILASKPHGTLYVGVTNSLDRRVWQHRTGAIEGFTKQHGVKRLVYFEEFRDISNAITRETEIKGWLRAKKVALIEKDNPLWKDLAEGWYDAPVVASPSQKNS
jgi:putative endonuclease